ncbi:MAG: response regulator transcription factor [Gemmatimonadetes bacterium]|nr:response regulator transcription factor [Gemmatimonadota bacterium]
MRVLLVEDDPRLSDSVAAYLRRDGFSVDTAATGSAALRQAGVESYDVVVLDLKLPDVDGLEVCTRLRAKGFTAPVLMATARDAIRDRVAGLDTGADDYIVKPYALEELVARVRALLRRPRELMPVTLQAGELELDTAARRARVAGRPIELTTKEYAVLEVFLRHPDEVLTRETISSHAWDENYDPLSNVVDVYIMRLRKKLEADGGAPTISTVRGAGYRLSAEVET